MDSNRLKAAKEGKTHYDGSACKTCGETMRYVSTGQCVACNKIRTYSQREKIRDLIRAAREGV